jgi:hypothetical protein
MKFEKSDVITQLEENLGQEVTAETLQTISFLQPVAVSTTSENAAVTKRSILIARPNQCHLSRALDVSGLTTTGTDGTITFRLRSFLCHTGEDFAQPINVVVTPISRTPCFATVRAVLVDSADDVEIQLWSWNPDGSPAPRVTVNWRCRVDMPIILG